MKTSIFESDSEGENSGNDDKKLNLGVRKVVRLCNPDGSHREFPSLDSASLPDEHGNWRQYDAKYHHLNDQGILLPEDLKGVALSHEGRLIPPGSIAVCSSTFHPHGLTRNIYIDVDGTVTEQGAICLICMRRRMVFNIAAIAVGTCLLLGLVKGLGWF